MSSPRGSGTYKNVKRNARTERLIFMTAQADLIAQKKREIEEKLAQKYQEAAPPVPVKQEIKDVAKSFEDSNQSSSKPTPAPIPFKNDGSFLEQFKQLQQSSLQSGANATTTQTGVYSSVFSPEMKTHYIPPPPPINITIPPPSSYFQQQYSNPPPHYSQPPPPILPQLPIKKEVKREQRSPSPYSPSRPCEDEEEQHFFIKEYHEPGPMQHSSEDSGNFSLSQSTANPDLKRKFKEEVDEETTAKSKEKERKRQSRWGPQAVKVEPVVAFPQQTAFVAGPSSSAPNSVLSRSSVLSRITSADPQILSYAVRVFGTTDLSEEQWKQCLDQVKMQYVYQEMLRKKQEKERLEMTGKVRYEYDSDEETEGGTWEHKRRLAEMEKTKEFAEQLTERGRGKHHLGHFLPPEELAKFMEKFQAVQEGRTIDESDYKDFKIAESNVGYQMLKKFGWQEGTGLGIGGAGITAPVNATRRNEAQGLGASKPDDLTIDDNEYDAYRKRMMLAYRFRPNPLNNPRRAYY